MLKSAETTAIVMALIATSAAMSWILSYENIPQTVSQGLLTLSENPLLILLLINIILLMVGAFMDMTPAVLIFTPIFLPVAVELGMSPLHFGIMHDFEPVYWFSIASGWQCAFCGLCHGQNQAGTI